MIFGSGNKSGLFYVFNIEYGVEVVVNVMNRFVKLSVWWLGTRGFSIGIDDVLSVAELLVEKGWCIEDGYRICDEWIVLYEKGILFF